MNSPANAPKIESSTEKINSFIEEFTLERSWREGKNGLSSYFVVTHSNQNAETFFSSLIKQAQMLNVQPIEYTDDLNLETLRNKEAILLVDLTRMSSESRHSTLAKFNRVRSILENETSSYIFFVTSKEHFNDVVTYSPDIWTIRGPVLSI